MAAYDDGEETDLEGGGEEVAAQTFRWEIEDFPAVQRQLREANNQYGNHLSEVFVIGGCKWQLLLFPFGNGEGKNNFLSLYLLVADKDELPEGWRREARFWLYIINHKDEKDSIRQQTSTVSTDNWEDRWTPPEPFSAKKHDWGFPKMIALHKLTEDQGFLENGKKLTIQAEIMVFRHWIDYRSLRTQRLKSRQETGYVGIYNQGATCYLNAWLQALFHTGSFRRAVYQIPTQDADVARNIPLALQRLFYRLQFHDDSVESKELTTAFRWSPADVAQQHDVHELNCKLLDNLEKKMKGTPADGAIEKIFRGEIINYIECVNVDYKSEVPEPIYDIGLVVKGCADIYESFDKYVSVEMLDGDNQYRTEGFGLQDAKKGLRINKLPPVLMLHLQRWELDMTRFVTYKVNDKYIFHPVLDLSRFLPAGYTESGIYHLHSILVHTGVAGAGHYYAYIRPNTKAQWYLFDDSRVAPATEKQAIEDNWGGFEEHTWVRFGEVMKWNHARAANAYMLLYVRETEAHNFMGFETGTDCIPEHIHKVGEEHLYMDLNLATTKDLQKHDQNKFDLLVRKDITPIKALRQSTFIEFMPTAAQLFGIPVENQRYWIWDLRGQKIFRPKRPLKDHELQDTIERFAKSKRFINSNKIVYLEDTRQTGLVQVPNIEDWDETFDFINFKFYDPETQKIEYAGSYVFAGSDPVAALTPICNRFKGFPEDTPLSFWEELSPDSIKPVGPSTATLASLKLNSGDIIVFAKDLQQQQATSENNGEQQQQQYQLPDPPSWYSWKRHGIKVRFRKHEAPTDESTEFTLELSKKMSHDEVAVLVAKHLQLPDHRKLRFTGLSTHSDGPRSDPCRPNQTLREMLSNFYNISPLADILFYEILPVTLSELDSLKQIIITALNAKGQEAKTIKVFVAKTGVIADALDEALKKIEPEIFTLGTNKFRFMEIYGTKIHKIFTLDTPLNHLFPVPYFVEELAPDEVELAETDQLVRVNHYALSPYGHYVTFGVPLHVVIHQDETVASIKARIKARLEVSDEDFATWKFALIEYTSPKILPDDQDLSKYNFSHVQYSLGLLRPDEGERLPAVTWHQQHHEERNLQFGDDD